MTFARRQRGEACPKRADASQALRPVFSQVQVKSIFADAYRLQGLSRKLLMLRRSTDVVDRPRERRITPDSNHVSPM